MKHQPDEFDSLYKDVRDDLLVEAYALTGDLTVSRAAVRDACAVAWHHWNKVRRIEDKTGWLRPYVWKRARVRHSVRPWHKERNLPDDAAFTLAALDKLTLNQRKALVLTHLSPVPIAEAAREIGVTVAAAEELTAAATADFVRARGVDEARVAQQLASLREVADGRWPRSSIVRRAGTTRRRTHTFAAVMGTIALVIASGTVVAQGENLDVGLDQQGFERRPSKVDDAQGVPILEADTLLQADQARRIAPTRVWTADGTHDNTTGDGLVMPCQAARFADPAGQAWYRGFVAQPKGTPRTTDSATADASPTDSKAATRAAKKASTAPRVSTMVELSADDKTAGDTFDTVTSWFAGCTTPRTQLLTVREVGGVGEEAMLYTFRDYRRSPRTLQVGVARSGQRVTTTVTDVKGTKTDPSRAAELLAAAVNAQCGEPGAGTCASPPQPETTVIPSAGLVPGMVSEFDLPAVGNAPGPWAGTKPAKATKNYAATICDETTFDGSNFSTNLTRTFNLIDVKNPGILGLTQTVGTAKSPKAAKAFVTQVKRKLDRCGDEGFGTDVQRLADKAVDGGVMSAWQVTVAVSDSESVPFQMAIMRYGSTVSQIGFTPVRDLRMARDDFVWLAERAQERLPRLALEAQADTRS